MKKHLITERDTENLPVFVLQGIGGAGKSEVAIKFAAENKDRFVLADWILRQLLIESASGVSSG